MTLLCDLHTHSTASDGTVKPADLPRLAKQAGLQAFALTDHDTTAGLAPCKQAANRLGIAFVPGIEISANPIPPQGMPDDYPRKGTLHLLGLFIQHDDPQLQKIESCMKDARNQRNPEIVQKLQSLGVKVDYDQVLAIAQESDTKIIGRPHIAQAMVQKGYVKTIKDAFSRYLGQGKPAYVRRDHMAPEQAIKAIHHAGGLAILAHPIQLGLDEPTELAYCVTRLKQLGLDGIEIYHSSHTPLLVKQYRKLAEQLKLYISGGSDFHGTRKTVELASPPVLLEVYEKLEHAHRRALI